MGCFTAFYLHYADLKDAASQNDFSAVKIAYYRCEDLRRQKENKHPGRLAFVQWATTQIRENPQQITTQKKLLDLWFKMSWTTRKAICACDPRQFFQSSKSISPLIFAELARQAHGNDAHQARGHTDDDSLSGDGLNDDMPPDDSAWNDVPDPPSIVILDGRGGSACHGCRIIAGRGTVQERRCEMLCTKPMSSICPDLFPTCIFQLGAALLSPESSTKWPA
jgi:hypothetical protein